MQAVVSLLPEPYYSQVTQIWRELEERFGPKYVQITPIPHITWQLGESYQDEAVLADLHELTLKQAPFEIRTQGVDHFSGSSPVLFIDVCKSEKLLQLHSQLWNRLLPLTLEPSFLYSVETWQPHITLAMEDLSWEMMDGVTLYLEQLDLDWHFMVDNIAILCQQGDGKSQVEHIFRFGRGLTESFDCGLPIV